MSMLEWAKREIEIACNYERKENPDTNEKEFDYGVACYKSALKAFESLCEDGHSGYSICFTKHILNRLIDGKPLAPITGASDEWNEIDVKDEYKLYQNQRMSSLFKTEYKDGTVTYRDNDRVACIDLKDNSNTYRYRLASDVIDEIMPITMPYNPTTSKIKVFCEDCLVDPENGDFDTFGIIYYMMPNDKWARDIKKYYKVENDKWVEISQEEFEQRMDKGVKHKRA